MATLAITPPVHAAETLPLAEAVDRLPLGTESRDGCSRDKFRHWNAVADPTDGCHPRAEVLLHEAIEPPTVGAGCRLEGGSWYCYYDGVTVTPASGPGIDHMVPLAEALGQRGVGLDRAAPRGLRQRPPVRTPLRQPGRIR
jgi:hypothetical protein